MPRMLANEYVYSSASAMDDCYNNDYITSPTTQQQQQHNITTPMQSSLQKKAIKTKTPFQSPTPTPMEQETSSKTLDNLKQSPEHPEQAIHTISSSEEDEELEKEQFTVEELTISVLSDDTCGDFEGFDDDEFTTANSSGLINDASQEDTHNYLKRRSYTDYFDYREDSEGLVEAIEVEDEAIAIGDDGQIIYKSHEEVTPAKSLRQLYECNPHTPNKRKKQDNDTFFSAISPTNLKTPPDQIVEINSDSTTHSQKQKRQQINSKFQLNLSQQQLKLNNTANKCSSESTSEFPVSSPSNPQQPRGGGKYPPRPPLLKNTLPADSFERQLAMITACNPQMTLAEKIENWVCEDEFSDVEDVNVFDKKFKRMEEQKKAELKQKNKGRRGAAEKQAVEETKKYDFSKFRQMIITKMKEQKNQKYFGGGQGGTGGAIQSGRCLETSGSESSKSIKHIDHERPTTSAVAQQQLMQQRRAKAQLNFELGEIKKRMVKENPKKRNQNSTTPPQTSSSDNEQDCFQNSKNQQGHDKQHHHQYHHTRQIHIHDKLLCPSSSEEANSQDIPTSMQLKSNPRLAAKDNLNNLRIKSHTRSEGIKQNENKTISKNLRCTAEEIDSGFRLHRLNREIDKHLNQTRQTTQTNEANETPKCLIQMRLDFANENKTKTKLSLEKKQELFKTPIIPQKYLPVPNTSQTENQTQSSISPIKISLNEAGKSTETSFQSLNSTFASITPDKEVCKDNMENDKDTNDKYLQGVYHQQHEFCNYLGLTGMSTATAMANAVAELAQCNLARRSMRVLRQQQQERKDKSAKEERELQALKIKQLKELRKRERGGCDVPIEVEEIIQKSDEGSPSQTSEPTASTPSLKEIKKKTSDNFNTKSSTKSLTSIVIVKKEAEIKILCNIAAKNKEETKQLSKEYVKEITQPIRETLMRQVKQRKEEKLEKDVQEEKEMEVNAEKENEIVVEKTGEKIEIKKEIQCETKTDCNKKDGKVEKLTATTKQQSKKLRRRSLRSPRLLTTKKDHQVKMTKSHGDVSEIEENHLEDTEPLIKEQKEPLGQHKEVTNEYVKESAEDTQSVTKCLEINSNKSFLNIKDIEIEETNEHKTVCDKIALIDTGKPLASTTTPVMLQHKIQMALEESRKSKPSIFIVQSLDSKKEPLTKPLTCDSVLDTKVSAMEHCKPLITPIKVQVEKDMKTTYTKTQSLKITKQFNKKDLKNVFKTRRGKKQITTNLKTAPKRQLRKRKIIVIKTTKPRKKFYEKSKVFQRELRSSPRPLLNKSKSLIREEDSSTRKAIQTLQSSVRETKSYRTVHTETKDLETYLHIKNSQTKTRLMTKASNLLERSSRMSLRGASTKSMKSKLATKVNRSKLSLRATRQKILKSKAKSKNNRKYKSSTSLSSSTLLTSPPESRENIITKTETEVQTNITALNLLDNENVVVSSTTNTYDERPSSQHHHHQEALVVQTSPILQRPLHNSLAYVINPSPAVETEEQFTQVNFMAGRMIRYLNTSPSPTQLMHNPLKSEYGVVLYIYYELDILMVIQERLVSFWKCSKLINILSALTPKSPTQQQQNKVNAFPLSPKLINVSDVWCNNHHTSADLQVRQPACSSSSVIETNNCGEWIQLGELPRLNFDFEISVPYSNRICHHNSIPIYLEMRARQLPKNHRDCNLLSLYINIYYYHDEDMIAKCNSIQLDTIQSDIKSVNYTTLIDSRYFIMTWPQENLLGKTRSGLCKYSLTPQLDTLASIREFKSMRHTIRYLECLSDDKLIGFGETQVTIWDHRSGDVLMHYDLEIPIGKNFGSVYFSSQDIEQNNMLILYQYRDFKNDNPPELMIIACTLTHTQPSYRILQQLTLPLPAFKIIKSAINTGDHLVLTAQNDEELWVSTTNPSLMSLIPTTQDNKRFYSRERTQLIELTEKTLNVDTLSNHILQIAAGLSLET